MSTRHKSGGIAVDPRQTPAPIEPFEFLADESGRTQFLEALFYERERFGKVVRLEFSREGVKVFYPGGLIATIKDARLGNNQDSGPLLVSIRLFALLGISYGTAQSIVSSCDAYDDYCVVVARDRQRTTIDFVRSKFGYEPSWSWWREK